MRTKSWIRCIPEKKLRRLASKVNNVRELCELIGCNRGGNQYRILLSLCNEYALFPVRGRKRKAYTLSPLTALRRGSGCSKSAVRSVVLRNSLLPYRCVLCGNTGKHRGKKLSLHLDHINGVNTDHRITNLRWLCPNCHSQTDTFGSKNRK